MFRIRPAGRNAALVATVLACILIPAAGTAGSAFGAGGPGAGIGGAGAGRELVVDAGGKGDFTKIQDAIASVAVSPGEPVTIFVRKGLYREKIFIDKSGVILVGEDRDSTRIVYPELRENWNREHDGSDRGSGVVNIDTGVTDVTIANLTIYNNYGSLTGAYNKHQFAIRGAGTRIIADPMQRHLRRRRRREPLEQTGRDVLPHRVLLRGVGGLRLPARVVLHLQLPLLRAQPAEREHLARRERRQHPEVRHRQFLLRRCLGISAREEPPRRAVLPPQLQILGEHGRPAVLQAAVEPGSLEVGGQALLLRVSSRRRGL